MSVLTAGPSSVGAEGARLGFLFTEIHWTETEGEQCNVDCSCSVFFCQKNMMYTFFTATVPEQLGSTGRRYGPHEMEKAN